MSPMSGHSLLLSQPHAQHPSSSCVGQCKAIFFIIFLYVNFCCCPVIKVWKYCVLYNYPFIALTATLCKDQLRQFLPKDQIALCGQNEFGFGFVLFSGHDCHFKYKSTFLTSLTSFQCIKFILLEYPIPLSSSSSDRHNKIWIAKI